MIKIKLKISVLVGPLTDIQPFSHPFTLISPGYWAISGAPVFYNVEIGVKSDICLLLVDSNVALRSFLFF